MSPNAEICFFLFPPAIYLLLLAKINMGKRPCIINGATDRILLGLALAGPILVGPFRFLPLGETFAFWGLFNLEPLVWALFLFTLIATICLFAARARRKIVIYNIDPDAVGPLLRSMAEDADPSHHQLGNSLYLPALGIQFYVESTVRMRNVELVATTRSQDPAEWARLETALRKSAATLPETARRPWFPWLFALVGAGLFLLALPSLGRVLSDWVLPFFNVQ